MSRIYTLEPDCKFGVLKAGAEWERARGETIYRRIPPGHSGDRSMAASM